jgi:hypothetical protein
MKTASPALRGQQNAARPLSCDKQDGASSLRMAMLERFVEHCTQAGARFARMGDVARELRGVTVVAQGGADTV